MIIKPVKFIDGLTSATTGNSHALNVPSGKMTVEVSFTEGAATTCSALTIDIEGSLTGNSWFALASHTLTSGERTAKAAMFHVVDKPVLYIRGNITTLTKTGVNNVTVSAWLVAK